jgi:O-succinylbenzoic acid--CoA ligase
MTRPLKVVDPADPIAVRDALREALVGGPAIFPAPFREVAPFPEAPEGFPEAPEGFPEALEGPPVPDEVEQRIALVVESSGSTGRPKRVALSADAVLASAAAAESALGGAGEWLLALPVNYIAGVNVLARSITGGLDPVVVADSEVGSFGDAAASMTALRRYTSLVPVQLARLIDVDALLEPLRRFDRILVGGQAVPVDLLARSLELGLNVTRTYGSAETCGGCVWDGLPLADTLVLIEAERGGVYGARSERAAGAAARELVVGRVELAGPTLAEGYLDDPARTAAAFHTHDGHRWYRTEDRGVIENDVLRITGRVDDVIVSGGVKVSLGEVEVVVRGMPGLDAAVVVSVPSEWGESPVVATEVAVDLDAVRSAVAAQLGPEARPVRVLLVDRIPTTATGKPDRVALAALALK